jgi:hypothetical protein
MLKNGILRYILIALVLLFGWIIVAYALEKMQIIEGLDAIQPLAEPAQSQVIPIQSLQSPVIPVVQSRVIPAPSPVIPVPVVQQPDAKAEPVIKTNPLELKAVLPDPIPSNNSSLINAASLVAPPEAVAGKSQQTAAPIINIYVNTLSGKEFQPEVNTIETKVEVGSVLAAAATKVAGGGSADAATKVEKYNF